MDKMAWRIPGKRIKAVKKSQPTTIAAGMAARLWQISTPYHGTAPRKKEKKGKPVCYSAHSAGFRRTLVIC